MKPGRSSRTAELVCMGRAMADGSTQPKFDDPTALALLPEAARARVERIRRGVPPAGFRERFEHGYLARQSKVMLARTVAVDDLVRSAAAPQLVILGAGLDGRAWRLPELADTIVFEVDHPDSQREKRARASALTPKARELRFVSVDFRQDSLDRALEQAGHDLTRPTTWIWEGVVMYLTPADVEKTLAVLARRSAVGSRLVIVYHAPSVVTQVVGVGLGLLGEPLRSAFKREAMCDLLAAHGFSAYFDDDLQGIGESLSPELGRANRVAKHLRVVAADRRLAR